MQFTYLRSHFFFHGAVYSNKHEQYLTEITGHETVSQRHVSKIFLRD